MDEAPEAIRLVSLAGDLCHRAGDRASESRALAASAHYHEMLGQRQRAEELGRAAVEVLGPDADGPDLARALEVNAYLMMMAWNIADVPGLVARTLRAGGETIDPGLLARSLNHRGVALNFTDYPAGRAFLDEARATAEEAGQWYEATDLARELSESEVITQMVSLPVLGGSRRGVARP